jgi:uncharacterized protein YbjT (DUF2867 family)
MSSHRILITGASGYLGGTLLARWKEADLPSYDKLYALVRTDAQAEAVRQYGAEPLAIDSDPAAVRKAVVDHQITIVYYLVDAVRSEAQVDFIKALAEVKKATGQEVHFLHVSSMAHASEEEADEIIDPIRQPGPRCSRPTQRRRLMRRCWTRTRLYTSSRRPRRRQPRSTR